MNRLESTLVLTSALYIAMTILVWLSLINTNPSVIILGLSIAFTLGVAISLYFLAQIILDGANNE